MLAKFARENRGYDGKTSRGQKTTYGRAGFVVKTTKKIISYLLILCLMAGLMPTFASAVDGLKSVTLGTYALEQGINSEMPGRCVLAQTMTAVSYTHLDVYKRQVHPYEYHTYLRPKDVNHNYSFACLAFSIKSLDGGENTSALDMAAVFAALNQVYNIPEMGRLLMPLLNEISYELLEKKPGFLLAVSELLRIVLLRVFRALLPESSRTPTPVLTSTRQVIIERRCV